MIKDNDLMLGTTKRYGFSENRYTGTRFDKELSNFAGTMGQLCEDVAIAIVDTPYLAEEYSSAIDRHFNGTFGYLAPRVAALPKNRPTFKNSSLFPPYIDALWDNSVGNDIYTLAQETDNFFATDFVNKINQLGKEFNQDYYRGIHPKARYLIDGLLALGRLSKSPDTLMMLRSFGTILPNVYLGTTQVDGIYLHDNIIMPQIETRTALMKFLTSRSDLITGPRENPAPYHLLSNCSILEIKLDVRARNVRQSPPRMKPRQEHIAQMEGVPEKIACEKGFAVAPKYFVYLSLGSLQPPMVFVKRADSKYWEAQLLSAERKYSALKSDYEYLSEPPRELAEPLLKHISTSAIMYAIRSDDESNNFSANGHTNGQDYSQILLDGSSVNIKAKPKILPAKDKSEQKTKKPRKHPKGSESFENF